MNNKIFKKVEYTYVNGGCQPSSERIIKETALTIRINGKHHTTVMIMAAREKEFVVGHLFSQGIINGAVDIKSLIIKNNTADVTLSGSLKNKPDLKKIKSNLKVKTADIFECLKAILKSEIFAETEAVHSAGLFLDGKQALCIAEDLGRHNALDKVIGYGLLNDIDFSRTLVASTGRLPSEMVAKICRGGIPIVATKAAVTDKGLEIGKKWGLTIIGFVRDKGTRINTDMDTRVIKEAGMKIYSGADRVLCE